MAGVWCRPGPGRDMELKSVPPVMTRMHLLLARRQEHGVAPLKRSAARIFQLNIGLYCNQACSHCHVESSPRRTAEQASRDTVDRCLELLRADRAAPDGGTITALDITGGAPELNTNFRWAALSKGSGGPGALALEISQMRHDSVARMCAANPAQPADLPSPFGAAGTWWSRLRPWVWRSLTAAT